MYRAANDAQLYGLEKTQLPHPFNSTDVKELPRKRQIYFWIAKGPTKANGRHWITDAGKESAQGCDTVWLCYIWKQWLWVKTGSKKYQGPLAQTDLFIHSKKSNIMQTFYATAVKLIIWRRNLAIKYMIASRASKKEL